MRIFDMHVHSNWADAGKGGEFLTKLDQAGYEGAVVLSPLVDADDPNPTPQKQRESIDFITKFAGAGRDRIIPFAHIAPQVPGAADAVKYAKDRGCLGLKMLPNHWYPYDPEICFPVYRAAQEAELPILFHSGILWGFMDSSRFCRPVYYEALMHFPKVRFALAHISWPWTDECIATWGRIDVQCRKSGIPEQMFIDCTPGTPRFYRSEAIDRAVRYCSCNYLVYGTDNLVSSDAAAFRDSFRCDREIMQGELSVPQAEQEKFFGLNLLNSLLGGRFPAR